MTANLIGELSLTECQQLLDTHHFGRLAFLDPDKARPMIIPVNYLTHRGRIVFRTDPGAKLTAALRGASVAFEVDGVQDQQQIGWSVVVQGWAEGASPPHDLASLLAVPAVLPWAPGSRNIFIAITPQGTVSRTGYKVQPIQLTFHGNYFDLTDFLFRMRNLVTVRDGVLRASGRLFTLDRVAWAPGEADYGVHGPVAAGVPVDRVPLVSYDGRGGISVHPLWAAPLARWS